MLEFSDIQRPLRCGLKPQVYMAIVLPLLIGYCSVKNMRILSYFSAVANVFCLGGIAIILIHLFQVNEWRTSKEDIFL